MSTLVAAKIEGFNYIGIDQDAESIKTTEQRCWFSSFAEKDIIKDKKKSIYGQVSLF